MTYSRILTQGDRKVLVQSLSLSGHYSCKIIFVISQHRPLSKYKDPLHVITENQGNLF